MTLAACLLVVSTALSQQPAASGQPAAAPPTARSQKAVQAFRAEAAEYVVKLASRPQEALVLEKDAALRWDNPARTGEDGALFIWMLGGRPQLIGTIFTYRFKDTLSRKHELHSLAEGPLAAEFRGKLAWSPAKPGVVFQPVKGAPPPADNPRQRLSQMKALARDFAASMTDDNGETYQLRLLAQPLIRYEPKDKAVQDGTLFAFSLGTDPEALLLLESRAQADGWQWQFAFARFHYIELKATHDGQAVWTAPPLAGITNLELGGAEYRDSIYTTYHVERNIPLPE